MVSWYIFGTRQNLRIHRLPTHFVPVPSVALARTPESKITRENLSLEALHEPYLHDTPCLVTDCRTRSTSNSYIHNGDAPLMRYLHLRTFMQIIKFIRQRCQNSPRARVGDAFLIWYCDCWSAPLWHTGADGAFDFCGAIWQSDRESQYLLSGQGSYDEATSYKRRRSSFCWQLRSAASKCWSHALKAIEVVWLCASFFVALSYIIY